MTARGVNRAVLTLALTLFFLSSGAWPANAQGFISPFVGFDFGGDSGCPTLSGCEDKNVNFGASFGSLGRVFGIEGEFAYIPDFFGETAGVSSSVLSFMGNVMLAPRVGAVQPYGLAGLGLLKTRVELSTAGLLETNNNHFGWNVGGGLIVFPGEHVGIKGDVRYFHAFQDLEILGIPIADAKLDYGRASVGLVFRF
jgi:opacity protein-like surface antigen